MSKPSEKAEWTTLSLLDKTKKIQMINKDLVNWKRSAFVVFMTTPKDDGDYNISCAFLEPNSTTRQCKTTYTGKTKSLRDLVVHWKTHHNLNETQLMDAVYDFESMEKNKQHHAKALASGPGNSGPGTGKRQTTLDEFHPRTAIQSLLVGLCRLPWSHVENDWFWVMNSHSKRLISKARNVGFHMRSYGYQLQHNMLLCLSGTKGIVTYDSGTIHNYRYFPILYITAGYKPVLISVNPDSEFLNGEHTAIEINRLICQVRHGLLTVYNINAKFAVADGAANGQSKVPGRDINATPANLALRDIGLLSEDEVLHPCFDDGEKVDDNGAAQPVHEEGGLDEFKRSADAAPLFESKLKAFTKTTPPSLIPMTKVVDFPHIINNIVMHVVQNDGEVKAAHAKETALLTLFEEKGDNSFHNALPRIVISRWNTHFLRLEVGVEFLQKRLDNENDTEDCFFDRKDIAIIQSGLDVLKPLKELSDAAQKSTVCFFDNLAIVARLRTMCARYKLNPEKTKVLREAILVPQHNGTNGGRLVPVFDRWKWLCNDIVQVLASLCPHAMLTVGNPSKSPGGDQTVVNYSSFVEECLGAWFNERVKREYFSICSTDPTVLVAVGFAAARDDSTDDDDIKMTLAQVRQAWTKLGTTFEDFAALSEAVVELFHMPSTEADIERMFSLMKNIVTDKRKSLKPENVEACILVSALWDKFNSSGTPAFRRQPEASTFAVTRGACKAIEAYGVSARHNVAMQTLNLLQKYGVDPVQALLFPRDDQTCFKDRAVKITIDRPNLNKTLAERVPAALIHFKNEQRKSDRAQKMKESEKEEKCAGCDKLFAEHQDLAEIDESVECAGCGKWFHYSCSGMTRDAWSTMLSRIAAENVPTARKSQHATAYTCKLCLRGSFGRRQRVPNEVEVQVQVGGDMMMMMI
jgi:hypothetical protein